MKWDLNGAGLPGTGWVDVNPNNGALVNGLVMPILFCPSSPLRAVGPPRTNAPSGVQIPTYCGLAGTYGTFGSYTEANVFAAGGAGTASMNGAFAWHQAIGLRDYMDGSSNVLLVGEQSDTLYDTTNNMARFDGRSSGGGGPGYGFCMGSQYFPDRQHGLSTVILPVGTKNIPGQGAGYNSDLGANFPVQSAHVGGAHCLTGDGRAIFLTSSMNFQIFQMLLTRNDSQAVRSADF
jgi:hypothetical protein